MAGKTTRIGLIGMGQIGADVYRRICEAPQTGMQIAFVHDNVPAAVGGLPEQH